MESVPIARVDSQAANRGAESVTIARVNFWLPLVSATVTGLLTAGVAYGLIGGSVGRNTRDIQLLEADLYIITGILVAQADAAGERDGLRIQLEHIIRLLERQYGEIMPELASLIESVSGGENDSG